MGDKILFSVVIPSCGRPKMLKIALAALDAQHFPKEQFEVIVVDNCSEGISPLPNESARPGKLNCRFCRENRRGAHHARNTGAKLSVGSYLVFIDDDCEVFPDFLVEYQKILARECVDIAGGRIDVKWDVEPPPPIRHYESLMGRIDLGPTARRLDIGDALNGGNMIVRRDLYIRLGGMEPDQVGRLVAGSGDVGLCRRAQADGRHLHWVPNARVWHWQILEKSGRIYDLMRREFNNGIWMSYEEAKMHQGSSWRKFNFIRLGAIQFGRLFLDPVYPALRFVRQISWVRYYAVLLIVSRRCGYLYHTLQRLSDKNKI